MNEFDKLAEEFNLSRTCAEKIWDDFSNQEEFDFPEYLYKNRNTLNYYEFAFLICWAGKVCKW